MKLAIVGSRKYKNINRVRRLVDVFFTKFKDELLIVSGGAEGADYLGKCVAIEKSIKYVEFPPLHKNHNEYCIKPPSDYNAPYSVGNFFLRNTEIANYCDFLVAFVLKDVPARGTMDTVGKARKLNKHVFIYED